MIRTEADIARELAALLALDPALRAVAAVAGEVPLRQTPAGLHGLLATIVGQQVSTASARAIFGRFAALVDTSDAAAILRLTDADYRAAGFSAAKQRTTIAIAEGVRDGRLDLDRIGDIPASEAVAELAALPGIGVWTAECYLLFAVGHPDVFPAGDLALQVAVGHARALPGRPKEKPVAELAKAWSPHRSIAARLFWSYYHAVTRRDAAPAEAAADAAAKAGGSRPVRKNVASPKASQRRHDRTA
ncbi:DNA-3-methyladenine glycosylase family protein [Aureimonas leprariae]|uniref:DNA-3-methyladenine glycosylase II n=1 Tax=Plantimonas leprariae TaxID=2615207 RepID=A0A7V7TYA9_9HYPH|nr:DNA-3-methyladenine glycosylase [Aureimonas leprariae]KAB0677015.1 DNA-3-methyladenine glycosylase 2 family protein [Aureimonas leprariae]